MLRISCCITSDTSEGSDDCINPQMWSHHTGHISQPASAHWLLILSPHHRHVAIHHWPLWKPHRHWQKGDTEAPVLGNPEWHPCLRCFSRSYSWPQHRDKKKENDSGGNWATLVLKTNQIVRKLTELAWYFTGGDKHSDSLWLAFIFSLLQWMESFGQHVRCRTVSEINAPSLVPTVRVIY